MLISCYQCRNQLEVSPDSAGKRVRCPHCEHVIVVPGAKAADNVTALPSLELDDAYAAALPSAPAMTSLPPLYPLPPIELPAPTSVPLDEPPPPPSVERGGRRRLSRQPPPEKRGWGRVVWIGSVLGVLACVLLMCLWGSNWGARPKPQPFAKVAVKLPPQAFDQPPPLKVQPFIPPAMMVQKWENHQDFTRRFRAQFPGVPAKRNQEINGAQMAVVEVKQGEWEFAIAHRSMTNKEYASIPAFERLASLERFLRNQVNALNIQGVNQPVGANQEREWQITENTGRMSFVRIYFARDGDRWHHYLLKAKGPIFAHRFHADIQRFFASFQIDITTSNDNSHLGETLVGELDNLNAGGRRDKEFTAFAQHPTRPIVALGSSTGWVTVFWTNQERAPANFMPGAGKPVEQVALSKDGKWLATAANGEIQTWLNWDTLANKSSVIPGLACKFTRDDRLVIVSKNQIKEYDPETRLFANTTEVPDVDLHGLALSSDGSRLAVFGKKHIVLWDWTTKKLLGNIEAHDKPITTVAFSPDNQTLASASADRTIKLWDVDKFAPRPLGEGLLRARATLRQHAWTVASLAFHPDGTRLVSAGVDGMLLVWDVQPKQPTLLWAQANRFPVRAIAADEEHLYLTCKHPWNAQPFDGKQWLNMFRKVAWTEMKPNPKDAAKLVAQNAGLHIASPASTFFCGREGEPSVTVPNHLEGAFDQRKARVWDAINGNLRHEIPSMIGGLLSPDGRWLVFSEPQGNVLLQMLDLHTNTVLPRRELLDINFLPQMMFSADSKYLWVHQKHECVRYDVPTLTIKQRVKLKEPNDPRFVSIVASHDQRLFLASTSPVGGLRRRTLYRSDTGMSVPLPKPGGEPSSFLKIRRFGQMIELEDSLHGTSQVFGQQRNAMQAWAIHPDVKLAATDDTGNDQVLRVHLWDLAERQPILTLPAPSARAAVAMRFSADGRLFSYTTTNGWTRVVPLDWLLERKNSLPCYANEVAAP